MLSVLYSMASSLTRSALSFRRQGSSGIVWREGWIPGETDRTGGSVLASNSNVHAASDAVLNSVVSENMVKRPESSTNQVLLHSGSVGSNPTPSSGTVYRPSSGTVYRYEDHHTRRSEITSTGAPKKTNSLFTRWVKRARNLPLPDRNNEIKGSSCYILILYEMKWYVSLIWEKYFVCKDFGFFFLFHLAQNYIVWLDGKTWVFLSRSNRHGYISLLLG